MVSATLIIFLISTILLTWTYLGYPLSLAVLSKFVKRHASSNVSFMPTVTIIVPTYNEERVIEEKLKNCLELNYAKEKLEVIVVDSASKDMTTCIVEKFLDKNVKLIKQKERKGKAAGVNEGMENAKGEIIVITDANALMREGALKELVKHYVDPKIGGVEGKYIAGSKFDTPVASGESLFRKIENWIRERESLIDSTVSMVGEITSFRRGITSKLNENAITEDFDLSIKIRKKGYKIVHEPNAVVWEPAASTLRDEIVQKKRRVVGTIQTLFKHKDIIFNPKYGLYGIYILPSHKLLQVLSPFLLLLLILSSFGYYVLTESKFMRYFVILELLFIVLVTVILLMAKFNWKVKNPFLMKFS